MSRNSHVDKSVTDADIERAQALLRYIPESREIPPPDTASACTLEDVAKELGVSSERVRQIEVAALRKARRILEREGFSLGDFLT